MAGETQLVARGHDRGGEARSDARHAAVHDAFGVEGRPPGAALRLSVHGRHDTTKHRDGARGAAQFGGAGLGALTKRATPRPFLSERTVRASSRSTSTVNSAGLGQIGGDVLLLDLAGGALPRFGDRTAASLFGGEHGEEQLPSSGEQKQKAR